MENKPEWTEEEVSTVISRTREWVDVPFRHQGRSRAGADCVGLFHGVAEEMGRDLPFPSNYTRTPDQKSVQYYMEKFFDRVPKAEMKPGDFVMMRFADNKLRVPNCHVALLTPLGIIHAARLYRKVAEHTLDDEWKDRIEYVYRMRRKAE